MTTKSFSAQVDAWILKAERAQRAVFQESSKRVINEARRPTGGGGRMRVDTGFLRASGRASLSSMPLIDQSARPTPGATYSVDTGAIEAVIAGADIGDTVHFGFTASYAAAREFGARGQPADGFVRGAAQQWQGIVNQVAGEVRARLG